MKLRREARLALIIPGSFPYLLIQTTPPQSSALSDLLLRASPIAKGVLIILLLFSIYSWSIIITKWLWLRGAEKAVKEFLSRFRDGAKLSDLYTVAEAAEPNP